MENKYRIITQNLSCANGPEDWKKVGNRAKALIPKLLEFRPDVVCVQEGTPEWMQYLTEAMTDYHVEFVYRDTRDRSESNAIFYKKDRFELLETKTFWLSETPDRMSGSWMTGCLRICTYALLKDKDIGKEFAVFNTHLDHKSRFARVKGAKLVLKKINELAYGKHVILTGDMNSMEKLSKVYRIFTEVMKDAKFNSRYSTTGKTYNNYGKKPNIFIKPIDFVFVKKDDDVIVNNYKIIKDKDANGNYMSDHYGLVVDVEY